MNARKLNKNNHLNNSNQLPRCRCVISSPQITQTTTTKETRSDNFSADGSETNLTNYANFIILNTKAFKRFTNDSSKNFPSSASFTSALAPNQWLTKGQSMETRPAGCCWLSCWMRFICLVSSLHKQVEENLTLNIKLMREQNMHAKPSIRQLRVRNEAAQDSY